MTGSNVVSYCPVPLSSDSNNSNSNSDTTSPFLLLTTSAVGVVIRVLVIVVFYFRNCKIVPHNLFMLLSNFGLFSCKLSIFGKSFFWE